eukprot:Anaeramoba_ignava/c20931_g1_i1.p1 GENE.c20931_g1_i1~~c20931_g1_i1.p1  ORF type:complete len:1291 (-),score=334.39 c20931_g1_i1:312-4184(-)
MGFFSSFTFSGISSLISLAKSKRLNFEDISTQFQNESVSELEKESKKLLKKNRFLRHSVSKSINQQFRGALIGSGIIKFIHDVLLFMFPLLIAATIEHVSDRTKDKNWGYFFVFGFLLVAFFEGLTEEFYFSLAIKTGIKIRTSLISVIFNKLLIIQQAGANVSGKLLKLISFDCERVVSYPQDIHNLWTQPLIVIAAVLLIANQIGAFSLIGAGILLLFIPINSAMSHAKETQTIMIDNISSRRSNLIFSIFDSIKFIKINSWEEPFNRKVNELRNMELKPIEKSQRIKAWSWTLFMFSLILAVTITFICYVYADNTLTPKKAFVSLVLYYILRNALVSFPQLWPKYKLIKQSFARIEQYIKSEKDQTIYENEMIADFPENINEAMEENDYHKPIRDIAPIALVNQWINVETRQNYSSKYGNRIENEDEFSDSDFKENQTDIDLIDSFSDDETDQKSEVEKLYKQAKLQVLNGYFGFANNQILKQISIQLMSEEIIGIAGTNPTEKTALLLGLLGQVKMVSGKIYLDGKISYIPAHPWFQKTTVKNNIIGSFKYHQQHYQKILTVCGLNNFIHNLSMKDETIMDPNLNLNEEMKQRISFARALYHNSDIYLIDDFSEKLTEHTRNDLVDRCIFGFLKNKSRILISNNPQILSRTNEIYVIEKGEIVANGTFQKICNDNNELLLNVIKSDKKRFENDLYRSVFITENEGNELDKLQIDLFRTKKENEDEDESLLAPRKPEMKTTSYVKLSGGYGYYSLLFFLYLVTSAGVVFSYFWLSFWTDGEWDKKRKFYTSLFAVINAAIIVVYALKSCLMAHASVIASKTIHSKLFLNLIQVPLSFFNNMGRSMIQKAFGSHLHMMDSNIISSMNFTFNYLTQLIAILITICIVFPWFIIPLVVVIFFYWRIDRSYTAVSKQLRALEVSSKNVIHSEFENTLEGIATINCFENKHHLVHQNHKTIDSNYRVLLSENEAHRWLGFRVHIIFTVIITCVAIIAVTTRGDVDTGYVALAIAASFIVSNYLGSFIRMKVELQAKTKVISSISNLQFIHKEPGLDRLENRLPFGWIKNGEIQFQDVKLGYSSDSKTVLKNVNFHIFAGEKIGICGPSGSGKSVLLSSFFRLFEPKQGTILIDDHDIQKLPPQNLRSEMVYIPERPIYIGGTIRENFTPYPLNDPRRIPDQIIWENLDKLGLKDIISDIPQQLDADISELQKLSMETQHLFSFARALTYKNKQIVLVDDLLKNVLNKKDFEIRLQQILHSYFKHSTILIVTNSPTILLRTDRTMIMSSKKNS